MLIQLVLSASVFLGQALAADPPYGQLSVSGTKLKGSGGQTVALHGNSLFWSQWYPQFYNEQTITALKCQWNANVVRAAMGVDQGGYDTDPTTQYNLVDAVIKAAIKVGIYVIVDWHAHDPKYVDKAVEFFTKISKAYGSNPHIIYEIFNEPLSVSWNDVLVPYHKKVIAAIRANDPDNVIILGTPTWSQDVDVAAQNPVSGTNLMYTFHYYSSSHKEDMRAKVTAAVNKGLPIFVTEYGVCEASGDGAIDTSSASTWYSFLDGLSISYVNWAIDDKSESCASLTSGSTAANVGDSSRWTTSGKLVAAQQKKQNNGVSCSGSSSGGGGSATTTTTTAKPGGGGGGGGSASVSISLAKTGSWTGGGQYSVTVKNTGSSAVCSVKFSLTFPSGTTMGGSWNLSASGSSGQYTLASYIKIAAGASNSDAGFTVSGSGTPTAKVISATAC